MPESSEIPKGGPRGLRNDQLSGLMLIALALFIAWENRAFPVGSLQDPGPGYMPLGLAIFLGLIGLLIAIRGGVSPLLLSVPWPEARRAVLILLMCGLATLALERIGYRLTIVALLILFLGVVERKKPLPVALVAIGFSLASYYVVGDLLLVPLPRGPWGF
jgi:hypothetical protein